MVGWSFSIQIFFSKFVQKCKDELQFYYFALFNESNIQKLSSPHPKKPLGLKFHAILFIFLTFLKQYIYIK